MGLRHKLLVSDWHGGRPPGRPLAMSECIGCGRVDMMRECTGECRDVRLELVRADDPWGEPIETWLCTACGRIESPQPCVGVCIRQPVEMVSKEEAT